MMKRIVAFAKRLGRAVVKRVRSFSRAVVQHTEAVVLLMTASLGINVLLSELPFFVALPMWIEASMVIPVLACTIVMFLTWSANRRATRRNPVLAAVA